MTRNRKSAKKAGALFEKQIAEYLAAELNDDRIERRTKNGTNDRGDITGLRWRGHRIVIECKNVTKMALPQWKKEADIEAGNDDALVGLIAHKRHGNANPADQWVTMTLFDLVKLWQN